MNDFDLEVRRVVYDLVLRSGRPPLRNDVARVLKCGERDVAAAFARLAEAHMLVLQPASGEILMAMPFSAVPTGFAVHADGIRAWGNCIWDALGIAAMLHAREAHVDCACGCCGEAMTLHIEDGAMLAHDGVSHFALPPKQWWNDVVFT